MGQDRTDLVAHKVIFEGCSVEVDISPCQTGGKRHNQCLPRPEIVRNVARDKGCSSLADSIVVLIADYFAEPDGTVFIDNIAVRQALTTVQAMMIEALPFVQTASDMNDACEVVASDVRLQLREMREDYLATGHRPWQAALLFRSL